MLVDLNDQRRAEEGVIEMIAASDFPCVGAKAALATGNLKVSACHRLDSNWDDLRIHGELVEWAQAYEADTAGLRSLVFAFDGPYDLSEAAFEEAMWARIQSFADKDAWMGQAYDQRVSSDPTDPHFSLSFGGRAFFVVGLHPNASRPARRFPQPALVFNLHDQFERLRAEGRFERMRSRILERDIAFAGDINPMLARHGEGSAAAQFSGRIVGEDWQCPFADARAAP